MIRSIHGVSYTRLYNADILAMLAEFATDFQPPQKAAFGGNDDPAAPASMPASRTCSAS